MTTATRARPDRRVAIVVAVVLGAVLLVVALLTSGGDDPATVAAEEGIAIGGDPLPRYDASLAVDPAVGMTIPNTAGLGLDGQVVNPSRTGKPRAILFIAHWCPHCQREVPAVQAWLDGGGLPDGTDLYAVSTNIDPTFDNHPPEAWLEREGWTVRTLTDSDGAAAAAYGLSAFPYWVFVDADDLVVERMVAETPVEVVQAKLEAMLAAEG